jgi:mRNA interferase RelE/StbE
MKTISFTHAAAKEFDAIEASSQEAIMAGLSAYAISGKGDVKKLKGRPELRLRIGRYRVIFTEDSTTVLAIYIGKRGEETYRRH